MRIFDMGELDYSTHAPAPHALAADRRISDAAFRTWNMIHLLKWNQIEPEPNTLAQMLNATPRSVFRWLSELEAARWLEWNRNHKDPRRRYVLRTARSGGESEIIRQLRSLLESDTATIEQITALLAHAASDRSDSAVSSDSGVTLTPESDSGVTTDSGVTPDSGVTLPPESDTGVTTCDPTITHCDSGVTPAPEIRLPDAPNRHRSESVGWLDHDHDRHDPTNQPGATQLFLQAAGFNPRTAATFAALDLAAVQYELAEEVGNATGKERQRLIGRLVARWRHSPPRRPAAPQRAAQPPGDDPQPTPEHMAEAQQIAPADASPDEVADLAVSLAAGASAETAIDILQQARRRAALLDRRDPNVSRFLRECGL